MFATYITFYKGNKLPPFYIGYCNISNFEKGYRGTVSSKEYKQIWIKEIKEHPELFKTKIIKTFQTKIEAKEHEVYLHEKFQVHTNPMFINKSKATRDFYVVDYSIFKGRVVSEETKQKLRERNKEQFSDPVLRKNHLEGCHKNNAFHVGKMWINKDGKNKRVTKEVYQDQYKDWNIGRYLGEGVKFYHHGNRNRCPLTGRFLSKEKL